MLEKHRSEFPGKVYNRCRYMVEEIGRVQEATKDLEKGDLVAFGKKMYETHYGLSKLFEVSCTELDFLADEARKFEGVLGARMMGGGFGGCTINIVKKDFTDQFEAHQKAAYKKAFGIDMQTYRVSIREGTSIVPNAGVPISH
jgi:galactokinase